MRRHLLFLFASTWLLVLVPGSARAGCCTPAGDGSTSIYSKGQTSEEACANTGGTLVSNQAACEAMQGEGKVIVID